jgi:hypothetical protein
MKELAVLIPSYNGGDRLRQSVESCAAAGLSPERYALIVVDNCSTDGSIEALPAFDANNVPVQIYRNPENLGRVGNWNRAVEIAEQKGFQFAAFLFVGDTWAPDSSIADLLDLMLRSGAVLGMAPLHIVEEGGQRQREGARISIPGHSALADTESLLQHIVRIGRLPFAPIQANVYRLFSNHPLRFDDRPNYALNTDIEATVSWLRRHRGTIALMAAPFLVWNGHSGRFLSAQDPWFVMLETRKSLQRISAATGVDVDWESANAISFLTSFREGQTVGRLRQRLVFLYRVARYLRNAPGGLATRKFLQFTLNKLFRKQSYLSLPEGSALLLEPDSLAHTGGSAVLSRFTT